MVDIKYSHTDQYFVADFEKKNTFITKQDAREAMRVVFFCTYKMYLYAQNKISYKYIQILF